MRNVQEPIGIPDLTRTETADPDWRRTQITQQRRRLLRHISADGDGYGCFDIRLALVIAGDRCDRLDFLGIELRVWRVLPYGFVCARRTGPHPHHVDKARQVVRGYPVG